MAIGIALGLTCSALFVYAILTPIMSSGGILYGTPIPFRLPHEYEPADAMAREARQTLTQPMATGCSETELLRA
jgi:hypothetical protein